MNVQQVIDELRKWPPNAPVRVVTRDIYLADESGETMLPLSEEDAQEADEVRTGGGFILIWGGRP